MIGKHHLLLTACVLWAASATAATTTPHRADLKNPQGETIGTVQVTDGPRGVLLRIEASGLTPGWHGLHFHQTADCGDPKFANAGSHVHDEKPIKHGYLNAESNDSGDLPNIHAGDDGKAVAEIFSTDVSLAPGKDRPALLDKDGSAVIIHANADDHHSQPIGGAGDRVACAVLR